MAEELVKIEGDKSTVYEGLFPQIQALIGDETDAIANLANVAAVLKKAFGFFWVGFYLVKQDELVLGPFQGPVACTRIQKGKGVSGVSWEKAEAIIVDDVDKFPGHIACSSFSKSEIVVPLVRNGEVIGVLDVDSDQIASFDAIDAKHLNQLCSWLVTVI
ncbi:MAG: GAF domain-containing protein [Crocinitomicaceae bacterium]|nr:GAF domain-containing protein [Flavobacteriales bacterium]NQZ37118.1 GAF domain-containing protein [Crocinitomicaceae bacterium]